MHRYGHHLLYRVVKDVRAFGRAIIVGFLVLFLLSFVIAGVDAIAPGSGNGRALIFAIVAWIGVPKLKRRYGHLIPAYFLRPAGARFWLPFLALSAVVLAVSIAHTPHYH